MFDASNCSVCPLPVPTSIQIPGHEAVAENKSDNYLFIDSEEEQEVKANRLDNNSELLSNAKQLLDYDIISDASVTSATQDTKTLTLASTTTLFVDSESDSIVTLEFSGIFDGFKVHNPMENNENIDPQVNLQQRTPATIAVLNKIGAVRSRRFLEILPD